jgi:S1-C subfamily serine protease
MCLVWARSSSPSAGRGRVWSRILVSSHTCQGRIRSHQASDWTRRFTPRSSRFSGFSGGALVNVRGEVVGISTSALDRGRGLAVAARDVARVVESLRRHGRLRRGYLGISSLSVALPERQRSAGSERGLLVTSIAPGSPADSGQLLVGDVILAIDETSAVRPDDLSAYLSADRVGQRAALRVLRGASPVQLDVTIGERTEAR